MKIVSERVLKFIQTIKKEVRIMTDHLQDQQIIIQALQKDNDDLSYSIRTMKRRMKNLKKNNDRARNMLESLVSSLDESEEQIDDINAAEVKHIAKQSAFISNSFVFIDDKAKLKH
jgi:chromosome segregation ATPase